MDFLVELGSAGVVDFQEVGVTVLNHVLEWSGWNYRVLGFGHILVHGHRHILKCD